MRALLNAFFTAFLLCLLLLSCPLSVHAQAPKAIPDYGAKQGVADTTAALPAMNPLEQAGRAVVALVIVLAGVVGVVLLLKKLGMGQNGTLSVSAFAQNFAPKSALSAPAKTGPQITTLRSQTLPGGATLHLVAVGDRTLLLASTTQSITLLTEWEDEPAPLTEAIQEAPEKAAFAALLAKVAQAPAPAVTGSLSETTQRLRARLAQSQSVPQESV